MRYKISLEQQVLVLYDEEDLSKPKLVIGVGHELSLDNGDAEPAELGVVRGIGASEIQLELGATTYNVPFDLFGNVHPSGIIYSTEEETANNPNAAFAVKKSVSAIKELLEDQEDTNANMTANSEFIEDFLFEED